MADGIRERTKSALGLYIAIWGMVAVTILALGAIYYSADKTVSISSTLNSVLPVIATWVGTVIAFYFGKESYEVAANKTIESFSSANPVERLRSISVKDCMIKTDQITAIVLSSESKSYKLVSDVIAKRMKDVNRMVIFNEDGSGYCVVHRSVMDGYLLKLQSDETRERCTLGEFLGDEKISEFLDGAIRFVPASSSLSEVKVIMDYVTGCSDVFVTERGLRTEKVIGWITNADISKHLNA